MTGAEAQALNRLRAENIRNNMAKVWNKGWSRRRPLSQQDLDQFQDQVTEYDLGYFFQEKPEVSVETSLEREMRELAQAQLEDEIRVQGLLLSRFEYSQRLQSILAKPDVLASAQSKLSIKQALAKQAMDELLELVG